MMMRGGRPVHLQAAQAGLGNCWLQREEPWCSPGEGRARPWRAYEDHRGQAEAAADEHQQDRREEHQVVPLRVAKAGERQARERCVTSYGPCTHRLAGRSSPRVRRRCNRGAGSGGRRTRGLSAGGCQHLQARMT